MRKIFTAAISFFISGCVALTNSASPQDAQQVRSIASNYEAGGVRNLGATSSQRVPLRPGQWVAMLSNSKSNPNDINLQIMKVASVSDSSVTLEIEQYSASNQGKRMVIQQRLSNFPVSGKVAYNSKESANLVKNVEVESVKIMDESGKVSQMPQLPFGLGRIGSNFIENNVATGEIEKKPCSNSHFKASSCMIVPFEARALWKTVAGTTYAHSAVPVVGFITSESSDDSVEVVGFGTSGAKILIR